ncbi:MAG: hypothetical protein Q9182_005972 [Xanthomendoza sp. 2 TL-2023]
MAAPKEPLLDEIQWKAPNIAQSMGGIRTNTVLPYFYYSPFFDPTSNNATITTQATHNPAQFYLIQTREAFEARLRTMQGLEFIVAHDSSETGAKIDNNAVWLIRKQNRRKRAGLEDEITAISSYYVVGENIYMAPLLGNVLGSRLLSVASALDKTIATASTLPTFTPALGHTYLPPPPKTLAPTSSTQMSQTSKESTPMPGTQDSASIRTPLTTSKPLSNLDYQSPQLLQASFELSLRYGQEYMDENPLVGEPGSFIITKSRDSQQLSQQPKPKPGSASTTKPSTPQIKTDVPKQAEKDAVGAEKSPTSAVAKEKKARRKSRPAGTATTPT